MSQYFNYIKCILAQKPIENRPSKKVVKLSNKNLLTGLRDRLIDLFILIISNLPCCRYGYNAALVVGVLTLDADMGVISCDFLK